MHMCDLEGQELGESCKGEIDGSPRPKADSVFVRGHVPVATALYRVAVQ